MKLAFSTSGDDLVAPLDGRFGRAPKFLVFNLTTETFTLIDNRQALDTAQGAGIQAAEHVVRAGARAVVTGHCGPNAFRVLSAAGVKVFTTDAPTVAAALARYRAGALAEMMAPDVQGHWA